MIIHADFAQSPSGYVTGVVVPLMAAVLAWYLTRISHRADRNRNEAEERMEGISSTLAAQNAVLASTSEALAVLISQVAPVFDRITIVESGQATLNTSHQLLQQELRLHKEWAVEKESELRRPTNVNCS